MRDGKRWAQLVVIGAVFGGSVTAVLAHTYRLEPGGEFIFADDANVRRIVVTKGTNFQVAVLDTGGCTADIRAVGGSRRVASVSNPRSQGFVLDHTFNFRANRAGTTTYTITVRGEAFNGGDDTCDERSRNPLRISVVDAGGSDREFARAIRPEIRNATNLMNQIRANLRAQLLQIRQQFARGQITPENFFLLSTLQFSAVFFEQLSVARGAIDDMRERERLRLLGDPLTADGPVANGLQSGTCGAWDRLVDQMSALLTSQRGRTKAEMKRHFANAVREYERDGGLLLWSAELGREKSLAAPGVSLTPYEVAAKERVATNLIVGFSYVAPDTTAAIRGLVLGTQATPGINSIRTTVRDADGDVQTLDTQVPVLGRIPILHNLFSREPGQHVHVDISGDGGRTRSQDATLPLLIVRPRIIIQEES